MRTTLVTESKKRQLSGSLSGDANTKSRATRVRRIWLRCAKELVSRIKTNPIPIGFWYTVNANQDGCPPKIGNWLFVFIYRWTHTKKAIHLNIRYTFKQKEQKLVRSEKISFFCSFFFYFRAHIQAGGPEVIYTRRGFLCVCVKKNENPQPDKSNYIYRNSFNLFISLKWLASRGANGLFRDLLLFSFSFLPQFSSFHSFSILRTWYELATAAYFPLDVGSPGRGDGGESRGSGQRDANTPWRRLFLNRSGLCKQVGIWRERNEWARLEDSEWI